MSAVLAWRRERLPVMRFGALALYLGLAAFGDRNILQPGEALTLVSQVIAAWCLVASFRIFDDIADRPQDAVSAPDRVLVGVSELRPFRLTALGLLVTGSVILFILQGWFGPLIVIALALLFGGLYRAGAGYREYWVLLKYPIFVVGLGAGQWTTPLLVYLSFVIYECIEDARLREAAGTGPILACLFIGAGLVTAIAVDGPWWFWTAAWAAATLLSGLAFVRRWLVFAPVYFLFSLLVFQGARYV